MTNQPTTTQTLDLIPWTVQAPTAPPLTDWQTNPAGLLTIWYRLRDEWLALPKGRNKTTSPNTRKAYEIATHLWFAWLADHNLTPWAATAQHVRAWTTWLADTGSGPATINQRLAACSSYYSFIIREKHLVAGIERSAFEDAAGRTRANPFTTGNVTRPIVDKLGRGRPLAQTHLTLLFTSLEANKTTRLGSRNYALLLTHYLTGARSAEICRIRWGDIRPNNSQPGSYIFAWRGKGGKAENTPLPARAHQAIIDHLTITGRYAPGHPNHIQPADPIFIRLITNGIPNLKHQRTVCAREHISERQVQRIFHASLRTAGVEAWKTYRVHSLRRSAALAHYNLFKDYRATQKLLHHENIATTMIYLEEMIDPTDTYSEAMYQQARLPIPPITNTVA